MADVIVASLLGVVVGFLFVRYVLVAPGRGEKTFTDCLKKYGLSGGFSIGLPIASYFVFRRMYVINEACLLAYFLVFLVTVILIFLLVCWLLCGSVTAQSIPPTILKSYRKNLLLTLLIGGYPDVENHLEALRTLTQVSIRTSFDAGQLHGQLYGGNPERREQLANECKVKVKGLDLIRDYLKCSEAELNHFLETVRQHYRIIP